MTNENIKSKPKKTPKKLVSKEPAKAVSGELLEYEREGETPVTEPPASEKVSEEKVVETKTTPHVPTNKEIIQALRQPGALKILKGSIERSRIGLGVSGIKFLFQKPKMVKAEKAKKARENENKENEVLEE